MNTIENNLRFNKWLTRFIIAYVLLTFLMTVLLFAEEKPNIVYILVDDLGYGDVNLGIKNLNRFNNPNIETPNLAKLAKESIVFTQHYAASPVCSPSRAGLLTGRIPMRLNITNWIEDRISEKNKKTNQYLLDEEITIAEVCKQAGYETAIFGKWHLNGADWENKENWEKEIGSFPNHQGFDFGLVSKENPHLTRFLMANSQKNPGDFFNLHGNPIGTIKGYSSGIITDSAITWIRKKRNRSKPFFLYLPYDAVHECIFNPDEYDKMFDTGNANKDFYYANIRYLDDQIGRLLEYLESEGLSKNTIIFFSSDNGPAVLRGYFGTFRSYGTSYPLYGQKRQILEGGIRVPGMIRWPDKIIPRISEEPNSTLDVFPTICEIVEQTIPDDRKIDGVTMIPHLLYDNPIKRVEPIYWQYENTGNWNSYGKGYNRRLHGNEPINDRPKYNVSIRKGNYVLRGVQERKFELPTKYLLFDVVNDQNEKYNLTIKNENLYKNMKISLENLFLDVNNERIISFKKMNKLSSIN